MATNIMDPLRVHEQIDQDWPQHLARTQEFVRQPSISADGTGIQEMAALLVQHLEGLGAQARIIPTRGHPVVYGTLDFGAPKTLVIYGMYDVQPVVGETWLVPPFGGEIVDLPGFGPSLVSRGIGNSKGPLAGFFNMIESFKRVYGGMPVNLRFIIEGEEEQASQHLPEAVATVRDELRRCDAVFFPAYAQNTRGQVLMRLGAKGTLHMELVCQAEGPQGPRLRDIHGSEGLLVTNPAWRLAHALACLKSADEKMLIEDYYTEALPPNADDEQLMREMSQVQDMRLILEENDVKDFKPQLAGVDNLGIIRHYMFDSTMNINGLVSGYTGPGSKTVVPHRAVAKVDVRLVPNMEIEPTVARIRAHLDRNGFSDIEMQSVAGYAWSKTSVREPVVQALIWAYRFHGQEPVIRPIMTGSAPFYVFTRECGLPFVFGSMGHSERHHSPNEYAPLAGMKECEKSQATFVSLYAGWRPEDQHRIRGNRFFD